MENECPCKKCVCMPICRHKPYNILTNECNLIRDYIGNFTRYANLNYDGSNGFSHRVRIEAALRPTTWNVNWAGLFTGTIEE